VIERGFQAQWRDISVCVGKKVEFSAAMNSHPAGGHPAATGAAAAAPAAGPGVGGHGLGHHHHHHHAVHSHPGKQELKIFLIIVAFQKHMVAPPKNHVWMFKIATN